jgi:glutathione peroxidase
MEQPKRVRLSEQVFKDVFPLKHLFEAQPIDYSFVQGKVVLIENVASLCSTTAREYPQMNELCLLYKDKPFAIIGAPCNQFGHQETGNPTEMINILRHVRPGNGFVPIFPLIAKSDVNGSKAQPLFRYLRFALPNHTFRNVEEEVTGEVATDPIWNTLYSPITPSDVKWNFEKFLIDKKGVPRFRFAPSKPTEELKEYIDLLLNETD